MNIENHRSRVAADRRERMRKRLIESALLVFSRKGADAAVIEDVILMAEVSRGSFYNYFRTNEELMIAVLQSVSHELITAVDEAIAGLVDPAERISCGLRLVLHTVRAFPLCARFVARVGIHQVLRVNPVVGFLSRDIVQGIATGRFGFSDAAIGLAMAIGPTQAAIIAMAEGLAMQEDFPEQLACHVLLGFGLTKAAARRISVIPIEPLQLLPDSLLSRSRQLDAAQSALQAS